MHANTYRDLIVWQKSMRLVKEIYILSQHFPKNELYGLCPQMQRAAVAIPSNIAEGYWRGHKKEYVKFLSISLGSAAELETQLLICKSLEQFNGLEFEKAKNLLIEVMKMLYQMIKVMKSKPSRFPVSASHSG
jgi:four helix bundle protein